MKPAEGDSRTVPAVSSVQPPEHAEILARRWSDLNAAADGRNDDAVPITRLLHIIWLNRRDLHDSFPIDRLSGRLGFVRWFMTVGIKEYDLQDWLVPRYEPASLAPHLAAWRSRGGRASGEIIEAIWSQRPDLQEAFDLTTGQGRRLYHRWFAEHAPGRLRPAHVGAVRRAVGEPVRTA